MRAHRLATELMQPTDSASLPEVGFIREVQLVPGIIPISPATLRRWVRSGRFPQPVKLSDRVTAWRVEDVRTWLDGFSGRGRDIKG